MLYHSANATLTPFSKEDKILIKNPYECSVTLTVLGSL